MTKYTGLVGYVTQEQTVPGVWSPVENPIRMKGDVIRQSYSNQDNGKVNSDVSLNHRVSLIGNSYAFGNFHHIKWVEFNNAKWEVVAVELQRPRIIVTLGGLWNG